jgi:hypothetical protein
MPLRYEEHMHASTTLFKKWKPFDSTKSLIHTLQLYKVGGKTVWECLTAWSARFCSFLAPSFEQLQTLTLMHALCLVLTSNMRGHYEKGDIGIMLLEAMKLCVAF